MKIIKANPFSLIDLGRRGEHLARCVVFDISDWVKTYGKGVAQLAAELPSSSVPYPCTVTAEGDGLIWQITSADTSVAGEGKCELCYFVGEQLVKSCIFQTYIAESLSQVGETPETQKAWVDDILAAASRAVAAKEANENMTVSAKTTTMTDAHVTKSKKDGLVHLEFSIPKGTPGYTPMRGVDYWTGEDVNTITAFIGTAISQAVPEAVDERVGVIENGSY